MTRIIALFVFLLVLAAHISAQSDCPAISLTGPAGIWMPGEEITFSARINPTQSKSLSYRWTIKGGSITDGTGTLEVKVRTQKGDHVQLTATLHIEGLPEGCPATFSETAGVVVDRTALLLNEYSIPIRQINGAGLNELALRLAERPYDFGYIIEYFPAGTSKASVDQKLKKIQKYLRSRGQAEDKYKIVLSEARRPLTRIYVVPPGVELPSP